MRGLLKQSVIGGYIPIRRMAAGSSSQDWVNLGGRFVVLQLDTIRTPLRSGEVLRWEMAAQKCTLMTQAGIPAWNREGHGVLTLSSERVFFTSANQRLWQVALYEIDRVELYPSSEGTFILEPMSSTFKNRTSFELVEMKWTLIMDGAMMELTMTPKDIGGMVRNLVEQK